MTKQSRISTAARDNLRNAVARVIESLAPAVQIALGAVAAFCFAHFILQHAVPVLAVTVTITSLGFSRDARPRRILQTAIGMVLGIAISDFALSAIGAGIWQIGVVLLLVLLAARLFSGSSAFALTAGIQAMLVQLLPAPPGGVFVRSLDGVVGGLVALLVTALIPRDPRGLARTDAEKLFEIFTGAIGSLVIALRDANIALADETLKRVRRSQPLVDNWRMSLDSAIAVARISPFLIKYRDDLRGQVRLMRGMDLATRNLRVVVRRIDFLIKDAVARPYLAELLEQIGEAAATLQSALAEPARLVDAQEQLVEIIHQLDPKRFGIADQVREASVLLLLRPMLVDLLCASGMSEEEARAELPVI